MSATPDLFTSRPKPPSWNGPPPEDVTFIKARIGGADGPVRFFRGRFAWTLAHLLAAGAAGVTSFERPAPRWSHYIWVLRREGVVIETQDEKHGGAFRGLHGRYRLCSEVEVLEVQVSGQAATAESNG